MSETKPAPEWALNTLTPTCPVCGNYLLPCDTPNGVHPKTMLAFVRAGGEVVQ